VSSALKSTQCPVRQSGATRKTRFIKFGTQVVVVENKPGPFDGTKEKSDWPENVGRITGLYYREATRPPGPQRHPGGREERVRVLRDEANLAAAWGVRPVLVQLYRVDDLVPRISVALRAHDGYPVARRDEGLALKPNPPVEGNRKVLDDDQDPTLHPYKST
jgi:hypothetical protein